MTWFGAICNGYITKINDNVNTEVEWKIRQFSLIYKKWKNMTQRRIIEEE